MKTKKIATIYAVLAAALYAINVPLSKLLLQYAEPTMMAAFLYLGAGAGLFLYGLIEKFTGKKISMNISIPTSTVMVIRYIPTAIRIYIHTFMCTMGIAKIINTSIHLKNITTHIQMQR